MAWKRANPVILRAVQSVAAISNLSSIRIVLAEVLPDDPAGKRKLRRIAEKLVDAALEGQSWAIQQVADRSDGKPAQESTVNIKEKREASDWTREELMAILAKYVKKDDAQPTAPSTDSLN